MSTIPYLSYPNNTSNSWQMPWMQNNFALQSQYGSMFDTTLNFMQDYSYVEAAEKADAEAKAKEAEEAKKAAEAKKPQVVKFVANPEKHGKISFERAFSHISKGAGNFFKGMICDENGKPSLKRTLTTVGIAAGAIALTAVTGGAAAPALIALGVGMGGYQTTKGIIKACNAKTDAQADAAFEDIGAGITGIALSVTGAKGALKSTGVAPKGGAIRSTVQCFGETIKGTPIKGLAKAPKNIAQIFGAKNVKSNAMQKELYPIEADIKRTEIKLARQERRLDNIVGRQANPEKITKYQEQIANLKAKKAEIESYKNVIDKNEVQFRKEYIETIKEQIKEQEAALKNTTDATTKAQIKERISKLETEQKTINNEYQTTRSYYKYDRLNEISETGTTTQRIWANSQAFRKNLLLANSRYFQSAIYESQLFSGNILRFETPDGIIEAYADAKTGLEIDPSTLTKEQKEAAKLIKAEDFEKEVKKAVAKDIEEKAEAEKEAAETEA